MFQILKIDFKCGSSFSSSLCAVKTARISKLACNGFFTETCAEKVVVAENWCQIFAYMYVPNRQKRLDFCQKALAENETFGDVIFTDESSIQLDCHSKLT